MVAKREIKPTGGIVRGLTEILEMRIKHKIVPAVVHLVIGEVNPAIGHGIPCEVFIGANEDPEGLDLRALRDLGLVCYLTGIQTHLALRFLDAIILADPAYFVETHFEDEPETHLTRLWKRGEGYTSAWLQDRNGIREVLAWTA
jgi:hypothetical protein